MLRDDGLASASTSYVLAAASQKIFGLGLGFGFGFIDLWLHLQAGRKKAHIRREIARRFDCIYTLYKHNLYFTRIEEIMVTQQNKPMSIGLISPKAVLVRVGSPGVGLRFPILGLGPVFPCREGSITLYERQENKWCTDVRIIAATTSIDSKDRILNWTTTLL